MKIKLWSDIDDYPKSYIDHIQLWVLGLYIHLSFYPLRFWCWEWSIDIKPKPRFAIRFEFPSFSLYVAKRY